jgi:hypothetical protein
VKKCYYTNARLNKKTLLLAGPFESVDDAGKFIDVCGPWLLDLEPTSVAATFGVLEVNRYPKSGPGIFNNNLSQQGVTFFNY